MWKKILITLSFVGTISVMGCSLPKETQKQDYSLCNGTSYQNMAETEEGFFYSYQNILYYADKDNIEEWIPVCNKPDCTHGAISMTCNAYIPMEDIVEKDGKLYGLNLLTDGIPFVYEIATDGSGSTRIYDIPFEEGEFINGFKGMMSQNQLVVYYECLREDGSFQYALARLEDDSLHTLYSEQREEEKSGVLNLPAKILWGIRGDDMICSSLLSEDWENTLWRAEKEVAEQVVLPEEVSPRYAYISGNTFIYFKENEGFYKLDLSTGEEELLLENQLEDSKGYVLTEEYMIECNRYKEHAPENAELKFYNGQEWIDIEIPEEVLNSEYAFFVESVASDRIFFRLGNNSGSPNEVHRLYYFMIEDKSPKMLPSFIRGAEVEYIEPIESSCSQDTIDGQNEFEEILVFDTEEYVIKLTDIHIEEDNITLDVYLENKTSDKSYVFMVNSATINGLQCNPTWGTIMGSGKKLEEQVFFSHYALERYNIQESYEHTEYTDIELTFYVDDLDVIEEIEVEKTIHIYPYGEEVVEKFSREMQETDQVIIDNEYATVIVTGYENIITENDMIHLFFENKMDERVTWRICDVYVNGLDLHIDERSQDVFVNADSCIFKTINWAEDVQKENIKDIEEIEFVIKIFPCGNALGSQTGKEFVKETITLDFTE